MKGTILIAGASGGIGRRAAEAFAAAGWTVRRYDRRTDLTEASRGADVIFNGLNPPNYHNWAVEIPRISGMVIAAAKATGATVLQPGTVYVYGDRPGPWTEDTPHRPHTRKGRIRVEMEEAYRGAAAEGVRVLLMRAGDFVDPENPKTLFPLIVTKSAGRGKITATGTPSSPRAYAVLPDVARAMVEFAERRAEFAGFTEVGFPGHTLSFDQIAAMAAEITGRKMRIGGFPWWALKLAAPVWELGRELGEMRYLHALPHRIDGTKFRALFPGFRDSDFRTVLAAHLTAPEASGRALAA